MGAPRAPVASAGAVHALLADADKRGVPIPAQGLAQGVRALARAGASTHLDTVPGISADAVEACREQVTEDMQNPRRDPERMKFARHYPNVWYVNMGELLGIGFDVGVFSKPALLIGPGCWWCNGEGRCFDQC